MLDYQPKGKKTVANFIHYIFLFNHWKKKLTIDKLIVFLSQFFEKKN